MTPGAWPFGPPTVQAAGGAVWRRGAGGRIEVMLVHRPRYDDWTLPKGKLGAGEGHSDAALREVEEETGLRCTLGPELGRTSYRDRKGRPKVVRYWAMTPGAGTFTPNSEVDQVVWVPVEQAGTTLSYHRDSAVVMALARAVEGAST